VCGVMTAMGADPEARMKYAKIIGEKEKAVESVKFDFLGLYRPAVILGNSNTPGALGYVMPLLHWAMPSRYHSIHKNDLARAMVAQSEQAFLAIARGKASRKASVKILEYKEMEPFSSTARATSVERGQNLRSVTQIRAHRLTPLRQSKEPVRKGPLVLMATPRTQPSCRRREFAWRLHPKRNVCLFLTGQGRRAGEPHQHARVRAAPVSSSSCPRRSGPARLFGLWVAMYFAAAFKLSAIGFFPAFGQ
jgi:hypothetical protein